MDRKGQMCTLKKLVTIHIFLTILLKIAIFAPKTEKNPTNYA